MNESRRTFLQQLSWIGAGAVGLKAASPALASSAAPDSEDTMGVLVDLTKCTGCRSCETACRQANGFVSEGDAPPPAAQLDGPPRRPGPDRYTVVNSFSPGESGEVADPVYAKVNCLHCLQPACVSACLVKALERQPNGAVAYDPWKCMGCRYCMVACPFQIPSYEYDDAWTPEMRKCTFCMQKGNPHAGGTPACVEACPMECLTYGKRSELLESARRKIREEPDRYIDHVYGEHEAGGTSWLYLSGVSFEELGFLDVDDHPPSRLAETIQHGVFKHFMPPVAWCGILGMAMWLTKPEGRIDHHRMDAGEEAGR